MRKTLLSLFASLFVAIVYAAPTVITEQPEGELKTYMRSGGTAYRNWLGYWTESQDPTKTYLVFAADGKTVYWQNPISKYTKSTAWIKGEINDNGTQIVFPAGQYLTYDEQKQYGYQLYHINNIVLDADGYYWESFNVDRTTPITLAVDGDKLTLEGTSDKDIIAMVSDDDEPDWNYYGDAETVLVAFEAEDAVTAPEGLQTSTYILSYGTSGQSTANVEVGFDGNDMYVQGIYNYLPKAWLKGTVEGNTVTLNSGQYLGDDDGNMMYWVAATIEQEYDSYWEDYINVYKYADKITFTLNPETGVYTADKTLIVSSLKDGINRWGTYVNPVLTPIVDVAATPADPEITDFENPGYDEDEEEDVEGYIDFTINPKDVDGNALNIDNIYYRLYVNNDEPLTLTTDLYEELDEDMTILSYAFDDDWDIYANTKNGDHSVSLYNEYERVGVQVIYRGGDEERVSNIVYSDGSVSQTSGINKISASQNGAKRTEYFDLSGRRVSEAAAGQVIIKRTIDANGSVKTDKVVK